MTQKKSENPEVVSNTQLPPLVKSIKVTKDTKDKGVLELTVEINPQLQRLVYEQFYKEKAKDATMQGFRKGQVPREVLEPQIYKEVADKTLAVILQALPMEVAPKLGEILGEDYVVISEPILEKLDFKMIEVPATVVLKYFVAKKPKLPDLTKFKLKQKPKVTVSNEEIEKAIEDIFEQWKKSTDKKTASKFSKPTDEWVKLLKLPNVQSLKDLREYLKKTIKTQKEGALLGEEFNRIFHEILHAMKLEIPDEYVKLHVQRAKEQLEQQLSSLGVTFKQYLESNNMTEKDFEEQIRHQVEDTVKNRLFWDLFVREYNITIDQKKDVGYLQEAAYQLASQKQGQNIGTTELLVKALLLKAQEYLLALLGFIDKPGLLAEADNSQEAVGKKSREVEGSKEKLSEGTKEQKAPKQEKKGQKPKILIPEDAKI